MSGGWGFGGLLWGLSLGVGAGEVDSWGVLTCSLFGTIASQNVGNVNPQNAITSKELPSAFPFLVLKGVAHFFQRPKKQMEVSWSNSS